MALNHETGDRLLPAELPAPKRRRGAVWQRAAFGAPKPLVRIRPARQRRQYGSSTGVRNSSEGRVSSTEERQTVDLEVTGSTPVRVAGSSHRVVADGSVGRCLWPGWCSGEHGGLRNLNRQFESGPGYHLVVAQPERALPSEGRRRPFESDRRDGVVGALATASTRWWSGQRARRSTGSAGSSPARVTQAAPAVSRSEVVQGRTSGCYPGNWGSIPYLGAFRQHTVTVAQTE